MDRKKFPRAAAALVFCLAALAAVAGSAWGKTESASPAVPKDLLEVKVYRLILDPGSMQPVVVLADPAGEKAMPIWIGPSEAGAIQAEMEGTKPLRPMTHDLLDKVIRKLDGTVQRVVITRERENIYYAVIVLEKGGTLHEIDARPSDSIALALKFKAPIFISGSLFRERALSTGEPERAEDIHGLSLQELTPLLAESFGFKKGAGVVVADVREGSVAEKQGFQRGDIVVEVGGEKAKDIPALKAALEKIKTSAKIKIFRRGAFTTLAFSPSP
jgi:uncharacterized protein